MYNNQVIESIKERIVAQNHTLSVAESVTSGHLQAAISLASEASRFFQGGMTAYNLGQKARHLHVNPIHATSCNSVSETIADEMALNALRLFSSDWSIGITGYASPLPELGIKDLFAFYAIAFRSKIIHRGRVESEDLGPLKVQVHYANHVLEQLNNCLLHPERNRS
jgi:PncC family amidohydrolase